MYSAGIIADSISETGKRLTTFEVTFPRLVLAEAKTHRMIRGMGGNVEEEIWMDGLGINDDENLSRNSASSRAIPVTRMIQKVIDNPFIPEQFPLNDKGMQPKDYVEQGNPLYSMFVEDWLSARDMMIHQVRSLIGKNCHKQIANRLLEPFLYHTAIITATEWDNFFKLRTNEQAQYEIRRIADLMYEAYHSVGKDFHSQYVFKSPKELKVGEWHLPFISNEDINLVKDYLIDSNRQYYKGDRLELLKQLSVARCARVSYLTHDGKRDIEKDLELFEKLRTSGHWSPFEHVATPYFITNTSNISQYVGDIPIVSHGLEKSRNIDLRSGNFIGWKQFRKEFSDENCTHFRKEQ